VAKGRKRRASRSPPREQLTTQTIEAASREGEVQLDLGRVASGLGMVLAITYLSTGYLHALFRGTSPFSSVDPDTLVALVPLIVAIGVGVWAVATKWSLLPTERGSGHMLASALGVLFASIALLLVALELGGVIVLNDAAYPAETRFLHAFASLGASLALIGLALSWSGRALLKTAGLLFAAIPAGFLFLVVVFGVAFLSDTLLLSFMTAAVLFPVSGLSLHLLATGTNVDKRLILKSAEHKLKSMDQELGERLRALDFRDRAVRGLEADLQSRERELRELEVSTEQRTYELQELESRVGGQFTEFKDLETTVTKMRAEVEAKAQEFVRKERDLQQREAEVAQAKKVFVTREAAVGEREQEEKRHAIELKARERRLVDAESELTDFEARVKQESAVLDRKRDEVVTLEKEMELRESSLKMRIQQSEAALSDQEQTRLREVREYEDKVMTKEREVAKLEIEVRSQLEDFERREAKIAEEAAHLALEQEALRKATDELTSKEKSLSDEEARLTQLRTDAEAATAEAQRMRDTLTTRTTEIDTEFRNSQMKAADLESRIKAILDKEKLIEEREKKAAGINDTLQKEIKSLNLLNTETLKKEREMQRREEALGMRELEVARRLEATEAAAGSVGERDKSYAEAQRRLHEREEEFNRMKYQKEKELELREQALKASEAGAVIEGEDGEAPTVSLEPEVRGDRMKTGTRRFDDLLYGGFPQSAHVAFIGPAFAGKEVLIYKFIAEGLRAKEPVVIVTTSRPPVDVAKEIAPVLPSLLEYERLGLVRWIDASGGGGKSGQEGITWRVAKGSDFDAIYTAVAKVDEELTAAGHARFRLVYLTLSGSVGLSNEEAALTFFQRFVNRLRQTKSVGIYSVDAGMHSDQLLQAMEHLMDGAVKFKQEGTKRFLSVIGLPEVQTRNWVEYTATNREVNLRAFALERIR